MSRLGLRTRLGRATTGPPDFVGVGAPGAGRLWWLLCLMKHPDVERRRRSQRALGFFQSFCSRPMEDADIAEYHAKFPRRPGKVTGEWSQRYMGDFWTPALLHRAAPEAKLLVLLCDPIERYRKKLALELLKRPPENAAYYMTDTVVRGRYASQLRVLFDLFGPERVLVLQYERCRADPAGEYARTLRFLSLRDDFEPFSRLRTRVGTVVRRFLSRRVRTELWPDLAEALRADLEPEMLELRDMVPDLDFTLWPGFAHLAEPAPAPVAGRP